MKNIILFLVILMSFAACMEPAEKRVPQLIEELSASDDSVKNKAALELAYYEGEAKDAVPILKKLLKHPHNGIKSAAAFALTKIGTPEALAAVEQAKVK
ncbi:MAG: HEAT repeat domain-containing protein [Deltaproteobacteria bacterium]|nr:HEAT repeat domain-containing protein [Deltaproteobacteria bacterium]